MSKKCWIAAAVLSALAIALAVAIPALLPVTPGVTYANYGHIEKGMTREQLMELFGPPNFSEKKTECAWLTEARDLVQVDFDENGKVDDWVWNHAVDDRTAMGKLRDRVPWLAAPPPPKIESLIVR